MDTVSKKLTELLSEANPIVLGSICADNRHLFVANNEGAADVWMITLK